MPPTLKKADFETRINGKSTGLYLLKNNNGFVAAITNYGGRVVSLLVPDRNGNQADVVLGFDSIHSYLTSPGNYFGAIIGRYANRIAGGKFTLDGKEWILKTNNGSHHLHGGEAGFHNVVWNAAQLSPQVLELSYLSPHDEEGYPGNVSLKVTYQVTDDNKLIIRHNATTDLTTLLNVTHHSFFNLQGEGSGSINSHLLTINAREFTPINATQIPTGQRAEVAGTVFDFTQPKTIGHHLNSPDTQLLYGKGYDHNFILDKEDANPSFAAKAEDLHSGRIMEVWTTEPGLQFYGGNFLNGTDIGKSGRPYNYREAFCLEPQHFPDSPNQPQFPSTILRPGEVYNSETVYWFYNR